MCQLGQFCWSGYIYVPAEEYADRITADGEILKVEHHKQSHVLF